MAATRGAGSHPVPDPNSENTKEDTLESSEHLDLNKVHSEKSGTFKDKASHQYASSMRT